MRRITRSSTLTIAGAAIALVLIALALHTLAAMLTEMHVGDQALDRAALFAHGHSPWQWRLRDRDDLVAQRVFGAAKLGTNGHRGLRLSARSMQAYEIGLPLSSSADLQRASVLHVHLRASTPLDLTVAIRSHLDSPVCLATLPDPLHRGVWSLKTLQWHHSDGRSCATPARAAMLRLRFRQAAGNTVVLQRVALGLPDTASAPNPANATPLRGPARTVVPQLKHLLNHMPGNTWPVLVLPPAHSPQQLLGWRDLALQLSPAAIVLPHGRACGGHATPLRAAKYPQWPGLALYMLALIALLIWRSQGPVRVWLDLAATLFGPLWVIVGLHLGSPLDWTRVAPLLAGLIYALIAALRKPDLAQWRWIGGWRDYPAPLAVLGIAGVLVLAFGHAWSAPAPGHVLVYLAWALLQQWLLLAFVLRRLESVVPARVAAIITCATVFALLHTPNARLMLLCFGAELYWAWCFTRRRALVPVALAHALGALILQAALTDGWLRSLGISARYFMPS